MDLQAAEAPCGQGCSVGKTCHPMIGAGARGSSQLVIDQAQNGNLRVTWKGIERLVFVVWFLSPLRYLADLSALKIASASASSTMLRRLLPCWVACSICASFMVYNLLRTSSWAC